MIERIPLLAWPHVPLLSILIYHRVLASPSKLFPEEANAESFDLQMKYLSRNFSVMPLPEAVRALQRGTLPRRACCITFDDGYADNLTVALPILQRYGLTATVFVATDYVGGGCMFNDAIPEIIERTENTVLDLREQGLENYRLDSIENRRNATLQILKKARFFAPEKRDALVGEMTRMAGVGPLPGNLMLTRQQLAELSAQGVEIGGHTVSHSILATLTDDQARAEILQGKKNLEEWTGKPVRSFAYPNGLPDRDFKPQHADMVRDLGFELAVTTARGMASRRDDPFRLPRFMPWGRSMTRMGARMVRKAWASV